MLKIFSRFREDTDAKIVALQTKLEESKKRIRTLRAEMKCLEEQGVSADDLDMKILSLDYEAKKGELSSEMTHFRDLGMMISKLQDKQKLEATRKHLDTITQVTDDMDLDGLVRSADELTARRSMMDEENEEYAAMRAAHASSEDAFSLETSSDYARRVNELRLEKRHAEAVNASGAAPAEPVATTL